MAIISYTATTARKYNHNNLLLIPSLKSIFFSIILLVFIFSFEYKVIASQTEKELSSPEEILKKVDQQMAFDSRSNDAKMLIITPEETREKKLRIFSRGDSDSFIIFQAPIRDKGTKFLKMQGQLWTYFPKTEKVVKISGHLLRQPIMGSDFSYEDMMENKKLIDNYNATLLPNEIIEGEPCYTIHLVEKNKGLAYPERKIWVSKKYLILLREERYAKTGKLLKLSMYKEIQKFKDRYYPTIFLFEDKIKSGTRTELHLSNIKFGDEVPAEIFDIRNLSKEISF